MHPTELFLHISDFYPPIRAETPVLTTTLGDGMATMIHRSTFALDDTTAKRIRSLAALWQVSQAEVIRRAVARAETLAPKPDPVAMLRQLHSSGAGLAATSANAYLAEVRKDRRHWRSR